MTVGLLSFAAPPAELSAFNGGLAQVNPNFPSVGGDYPFIDMFLNGSGWSLVDNSGPPVPTALDSATGYPLGIGTLPNGGVKQNIRIPSASNGGAKYVMRVTGKGTLTLPGTALTATITTITSPDTSHTTFTVSGNGVGANAHDFRVGMEVPLAGISSTMGTALNGTVPVVTATTATTITCATANTTTLSGSGGTATYGRAIVGVATGGRIVMSIASSPFSINPAIVSSDTVSPITKISIIAQGSEEDRYDAGEIFGAKFLSRLSEGKFGVIRGLNLLQTNISTEVTWSQRKPVAYYTYGADMVVPSIFAGTTASVNALNDYTINPGFGALTDKKQITLAFDAPTVTITAASPAVVNFPLGHGFVVGNPFNFFTSFGGSLPINVTTGVALVSSATTYYVASVIDANNITFALTSGGAAINTSTTGVGTMKAHGTVVSTAVTFSNGSSTVNWTGNLLNLNDPVAFSGNVPTPFHPSQQYYVKTTGANSITVSATPGGAAITATSASGSGTIYGIRSPTLDVDGTGAIPIRDRRSNALQTNATPTTTPKAFLSGLVTAYATLTYDKILNCWMMYGACDNDAGSRYITNAWPPEIFLALCVKAGAHPWFPAPMHVLDGYTDPTTHIGGMTDYMPSLMTYVRDNKPSWMIPRFEIHNECWNSLFAATTLSRGHSFVYWGAESTDQYVGKVASLLGQAAVNVFGSVGNGYQMVVGVQTGVMNSTSASNTRDPRLTAASYVAQAAAPQSGYLQTAASKYATHVCCAQYLSPTATGLALEASWIASSVAVFTGSVTGTVLTVTGTPTGAAIAVGMTVINGSISNNSLIDGYPTIQSLGTGTGGAGTYNLSGASQPAQAATSSSYYGCDISSSSNAALYIDTLQGTSFTGTISGTTLTINALPSASLPPIASGMTVTGVGVQANTIISSGSGSSWVVSVSQSVGPVAMNGGTFSVPAVKGLYANVFTWAQRFTNDAGVQLKMCGYEGLYSPDYTGAVTNSYFRGAGKLVAVTPNQATGLSYYISQTMSDFVAAGGEWPSLFQLSGTGTANNAWSALDDIYQNPTSAYWNGVLAFQP